MFYITPDIFFSGKVSFLCLILPCQVFSCDVLACSIHCIQEGYLVKNLPSPGWGKTPQWGWEKWSKSFSDRCQTSLWTALGMVECHIVPCDHIYWQVAFLPLAPVFRAGFLKSHISAGVHFSAPRSAPKRSSLYCIL